MTPCVGILFTGQLGVQGCGFFRMSKKQALNFGYIFLKSFCERKLPCVLNRIELSRWNSDEVVVVVGSLSVDVVPSKEPFLLFFKRCFTCKAIVSLRSQVYAIANFLGVICLSMEI